MTKKHFIQIAADLKDMRFENPSKVNKQTHNVYINILCNTFKSLNPLFDADRFKKAAGYYD